MFSLYILDENLEPKIEPDIEKWTEWFANPQNRTIKQTYLLDKSVRVSSSFLGKENTGNDMFETMVLCEGKCPILIKNEFEDIIRRSGTFEDCAIDHTDIVNDIMNLIPRIKIQ